MNFRNCLRFAAIACLAVLTLPAAEHHGQVTFNKLPLPGATVTATQGDKTLTAVTDGNGVYIFPDLAEGVWNFQVEMLGFETEKREVAVSPDAPWAEWDMKMLSLDQMKASAVPAPAAAPASATTAANGTAPATAAPPSAAQTTPAASTSNTPTTAANTPAKSNGKKNNKNNTPANAQSGFQRTDVNASAGAPPPPPPDTSATSMGADAGAGASEAMVVNGSTSNGVERRAFGNGRRGPGSLFRGDLMFTESNSDLNAHPFSVAGVESPQPVFNQGTFGGSLGGPLWIPHVLRPSGNFFLQYQGTRSRNGSTNPEIVPTLAQRDGDFSQTLVNVNGTQQPVQIYDPLSGAPFPGNVIPQTRISPQAAYLLKFYPLPNFVSPKGYNFQEEVISRSDTDRTNVRFNRSLNTKNFLSGLIAYQNVRGLNPTGPAYAFTDTNDNTGVRINPQFRHNFSRSVWGTFTEDFSRSTSHSNPYFENLTNVSAEAGITGNDQSPAYWGPPSIGFNSSGITGLSDGNLSVTKRQTNAIGTTFQWIRRPHNFSFGGDVRFLQFNYLSEANPRGGMGFTGLDTAQVVNGIQTPGTGYDLADYLLGTPDTASIAYGNADKYFREGVYDLAAQDDWRITSSLSAVIGVRWEYWSPYTEKYGRLVNLDVTPGFTEATAVVATNPVGTLTNTQYPASLVRPDKHGVEPRLGLAWRPLLGSSLLLRAGYSINYNTSVYGSIVGNMMQQYPLSYSVQAVNSAATPLSIANPFYQTPGILPNTFAVDPDFRIGYVQTWTASAQQDIPWSMVMTLAYTGNKGTRGMQEFYPNSYPIGATNPCPNCPSGFLYETSNGNSTYEAGRVSLHRRFHNGFTGDLSYTYSKAIDDSMLGGAGSGTGGSAAVLAQNWRDLSAERALSPFDQRHLLAVTMQYSTGSGVHGGGLMSGWRGAIFKGWTVTDTISVGSGLPETPSYPYVIPGTNASGIRPSYTGQGIYDATGGLFLNPNAYMAPIPGAWGNVGRDSITGPNTFSLNANMARTFANNLDITLATTNALNHVVYTGYVTSLTNPYFGTPAAAGNMRSVTLTMRWRF